MNDRRTVRGSHQAIIEQCRERLGRDLTERETAFITSHSGFLSLKMVEETVRTLDAAALEAYLNPDPE